jgi:hypothetical protein
MFHFNNMTSILMYSFVCWIYRISLIHSNKTGIVNKSSYTILHTDPSGILKFHFNNMTSRLMYSFVCWIYRISLIHSNKTGIVNKSSYTTLHTDPSGILKFHFNNMTSRLMYSFVCWIYRISLIHSNKTGIVNKSSYTILQKFLVIFLAKKSSDLRKPETFITIFIKSITETYAARKQWNVYLRKPFLPDTVQYALI